MTDNTQETNPNTTNSSASTTLPPVHASQNNNFNSPSTTPSSNNKPSFSPSFTSNQKKAVGGLIALAVLVGGAAAGAMLVQQRTQSPKATTDKVDITLSTSSTSVDVSDTFTVTTIISDNNNNQVSAVDLVYQYNKDVVELVSSSVGPYFNATSNNPDTNQALTGIELLNEPANSRIAVGAACDPCYLGAADPAYPNIKACLSSPAPKCYPKNTTGQLATATFRAKAAGSTSITLNTTGTPSTQIAAIGHDDTNMLGDIASTSTITINPSNTTACAADIVDNTGAIGQDNKINGADFSYLVDNFTGISTCSGDQCAADIVDNTGAIGQDNKVNGADFSYLVDNFTGFGTCN